MHDDYVCKFHYILKDKIPVQEPNLLKWSEWMSGNDRHVDKTVIGKVLVSTVFVGLNRSFNGSEPTLLFETMVFGGDHDGFMERYHTWEQAQIGHQCAVQMVDASELKANEK
jgi:hypothetical protein